MVYRKAMVKYGGCAHRRKQGLAKGQGEVLLEMAMSEEYGRKGNDLSSLCLC